MKIDVTAEEFAEAMAMVRENVIVEEGMDDWKYFAKRLWRVKLKVGVQEFSLKYEGYVEKDVRAYAELLRKGLAYIVVDTWHRRSIGTRPVSGAGREYNE